MEYLYLIFSISQYRSRSKAWKNVCPLTPFSSSPPPAPLKTAQVKCACPSSRWFSADPVTFFHVRAHSHLETLRFKLSLALPGLECTLRGQNWFPVLKKNDLTSFVDMPHRNILMSKHGSGSKTYGLRFLEHICDFSRNRFVPKQFVLRNFPSGLQTLPRCLAGAGGRLAFSGCPCRFY